MLGDGRRRLGTGGRQVGKRVVDGVRLVEGELLEELQFAHSLLLVDTEDSRSSFSDLCALQDRRRADKPLLLEIGLHPTCSHARPSETTEQPSSRAPDDALDEPASRPADERNSGNAADEGAVSEVLGRPGEPGREEVDVGLRDLVGRDVGRCDRRRRGLPTLVEGWTGHGG